MIQWGEFSIDLAPTKKVLHGVGIFHDLGSMQQDVMMQFLDYEENFQGQFLLVIIFQRWP
jgi:hypothetical protein